MNPVVCQSQTWSQWLIQPSECLHATVMMIIYAFEPSCKQWYIFISVNMLYIHHWTSSYESIMCKKKKWLQDSSYIEAVFMKAAQDYKSDQQTV